eukprot:5874358-Amphidinium_carterae.1
MAKVLTFPALNTDKHHHHLVPCPGVVLEAGIWTRTSLQELLHLKRHDTMSDAAEHAICGGVCRP